MTGGGVRLSPSGPEPPPPLADLARLDADGLPSEDTRFDLGGTQWWATVSDPDSAASVLRAVQRGGDVVVHLALAEPGRSAFLDELRRVASVVTDLAPPELDDFQRQLVQHLRDGLSLREAATRLHVSSRTADRRLAEIRSMLGVSSTSEVLAALDDR